jgi:hypothetical protein
MRLLRRSLSFRNVHEMSLSHFMVKHAMPKDHPLALDDISWLAVKRGQPEVILRILALSDPVPATWQQGLNAVGGDYFDGPPDWAELSRVFITPLVHGWRLVIGGWVAAGPMRRERDDQRNSWRRVAGYCRRLSREFAQAHAFTDQGRMDWFSWILARDGRVYRQMVFEDDQFLTNRGKPTRIEAQHRAAFVPDEVLEQWAPDSGAVSAIAAEVSVNPREFGKGTKSSGQGFLAVTPWGQKYGVPQRRLEE